MQQSLSHHGAGMEIVASFLPSAVDLVFGGFSESAQGYRRKGIETVIFVEFCKSEV